MILSIKTEMCFLVFLYFCVMISLRTFLPVTGTGLIVQYQFIMVSLIITMVFYLIYVKKRNRVIAKKIATYLENNQFDECEKYLKKCVKAYPESVWMKTEEAMLAVFAGNFDKYKFLVSQFSDSEISKSKKYKDVFPQVDILLAYFNNDNVEFNAKFDNNTCLNKAINIIKFHSNTEKESDIKKELLFLYESPYFLFKTFASLFYAQILYNDSDYIKYEWYIKKAFEYSPSEEVTQCIQKHIDATNNQI